MTIKPGRRGHGRSASNLVANFYDAKRLAHKPRDIKATIAKGQKSWEGAELGDEGAFGGHLFRFRHVGFRLAVIETLHLVAATFLSIAA